MAKKTDTIPSKVVRHEIFKESANLAIDKLIAVYKANPLNARVMFFNGNGDDSQYEKHRLVLFEKENSNFEICYFRIKYGISVTNRMYHHEKKVLSICYSKGKFYYINKTKGVNMIRPLTYNFLNTFVSQTEYIKNSKTLSYLKSKFQWIQLLSEHPMGANMNFNRIKTDKLFSYKDLSRHVFGVPNNIANIVLGSRWIKSQNKPVFTLSKSWKDMLKYLDNIQNLRQEMIDCHYFKDSCKMAKILGKKVNCNWGLKRLKDEHDLWADEISNIMLDCEPEMELNISPVYKRFAEFSGYNLLRTNKELLKEGMKQKHCVGTYINQVHSGTCGIYHINGYTLQLIYENSIIDTVDSCTGKTIRTHKKFLKNTQFRGYLNNQAPQELIDEVQAKLDNFKEAGYIEDNELDIIKKTTEPIKNLWEEELQIDDFDF